MKQKEIISSWQQLTVADFDEISHIQAAEKDPEAATKKVIEYLYGVDDADMLPFTEALQIYAGLKNLGDKKAFETARLPKDATYNVNGTQYEVAMSPGSFTTAQYMDFTAHIHSKSDMADTLTALLIPSGHRYNDGYSMDKARADMQALPASAAFAVMRFFSKWSSAFIATFPRCLTSLLKRSGKVEKGKIKRLETLLSALRAALASSPSSSSTAS